MADPLRAAIIAEIERRAGEHGDWHAVYPDGIAYDGIIDVDALCRAIRSTLADGWQPINTAPKDGEPFLGAIPDGEEWTVLRMHWVAHAGRFGDATYAPFVEDQEQPTLWRPLPVPSTVPQTPTTSETGNA